MKVWNNPQKKCNNLCTLFQKTQVQSGVIVYSDLLVDYLKKQYPNLYLVSTTTKVLTHFDDFKSELNRSDFKYVVPDFRLNKAFTQLSGLSQLQKDKVEFILYYMTKPEHQLEVREAIYLDSMLDLF